MRRRRPVPEHLAGRPFSRKEALTLIGRGELSGPSYQLIMRNTYWVADHDLDHGQLIQAVRTAIPGGAVLRGVSAAWAHGVLIARADDPVEVAMDHRKRVRNRARLVVSGESVPGDEVVETSLGLATSHSRTAFDLARRLPRTQAIAVADALLRAGGLPGDALRQTAERHRRAKGWSAALEAAGLVDPRAESLRESLLRVALIDAGLPAPTPQVPVFSGGLVVARLDLAWPAQRVAIEYDGAHHREAQQHSRDLWRHNQLRSLGWLVYQVDGEIWSRSARINELVGVVRASLSQRSKT